MARFITDETLPHVLYHGSAYKTDSLFVKPGFTHTRVTHTLPQGHSNRYLYACVERDRAIAYGLRRAVELCLPHTRCHIYDNGRIISVISAQRLRRVDIETVHVFLYELHPTHAQEWQHHEPERQVQQEFKTKHSIRHSQLLWINLEHWLESRELMIRHF